MSDKWDITQENQQLQYLVIDNSVVLILLSKVCVCVSVCVYVLEG